jgi:hypothetical protein
MTDPRRRDVLMRGGFMKWFILKEQGLKTSRILNKKRRRRHSLQDHNKPAREILARFSNKNLPMLLLVSLR